MKTTGGVAARLVAVLCMLAAVAGAVRNFYIDYENDRFVKDGATFQYISGSIHYSRVPNEYWLDRLTKIKAAGLNAVTFYVPWNFHENFKGEYVFEGDADVSRFLDLCKQLDLMVLLRAGPYICGEWENGGLPYWLLKTKDIEQRTFDMTFITEVERWYAKLMPIMVPHLYKNGGPIIMIQIENEYGSYKGCDVRYTAFLRDTVRKYVGYDTVLFSVDGASLAFLKCGYIPDVYPTVDFGSGGDMTQVKASFTAQRVYAPRGPLVNSEYYPGWLDLWSKPFERVETDRITGTFEHMFNLNASVNYYMFHGGTNFGFWNGAETTMPVITSYDYDAPITEAGDITPKYMAIRQQITRLTGRTPIDVPGNTPKKAYGTIPMKLVAPVTHLLDVLSPSATRITSKYPLSMEEIDFPLGFVLYETTIPAVAGGTLTASGLKDRGYVMVDDRYQGIIIHHQDTFEQHQILIDSSEGSVLRILVENRGRLTYETINDYKGITSNVTLEGLMLVDWTIYPITLENIFDHVANIGPLLAPQKSEDNSVRVVEKFVPSIYLGKFTETDAEPVADTFFDSTGWGKGQFLINRHNVGRYWPLMGPQITLYTPKTVLTSGTNYVVLLELEQPGNCDFGSNGGMCRAKFVAKSLLDSRSEVYREQSLMGNQTVKDYAELMINYFMKKP